MNSADVTNKIADLFSSGKKDLLSIYLTAGYPQLSHTVPLIRAVQEAGASMIEVGMPYSDPLADGPTIQHVSAKAIRNGITMRLLFEQLAELRTEIKIPLIWMGYFNPVIQFGVEKFCKCCRDVGISGVIIPDLPPEIYKKEYAGIFEAAALRPVFLITPQTDEARIRMIDELSDSFIYAVASNALTGRETGIQSGAEKYLNRLAAMNLSNPLVAGFGIYDKTSFETACRYTRGAIIGSAFLKAIAEGDAAAEAAAFIKGVLG